MKCPHCNARSRVLATRNLIERRRQCENGHRFSTREEVFVPERREPAGRWPYPYRAIPKKPQP